MKKTQVDDVLKAIEENTDYKVIRWDLTHDYYHEPKLLIEAIYHPTKKTSQATLKDFVGWVFRRGKK